MKNSSLVRTASLLFMIALSSLCLAQTYTVTDLGSVDGPSGFSIGTAINASGEVTGQSGPSDGSVGDVFIYSHGTMTNLGTLGGGSGFGNGINASGQVAGFSTVVAGGYAAFMSQDDELINIGNLGASGAGAYAINDSGQVAGESATPTIGSEPFIYSDGVMTGLGNLGSYTGWSTARGINDSAVVVGSSWTAQGLLHGFAWTNGTMNDLGTLGGDQSQAWAINSSGQITGIAYLSNGDGHAFLTTIGGKMKDLGALAFINNNPDYSYSWGFGINDKGEVVGQSSTSTGAYHAFVYNGTKMEDLNELVPKSEWTLFEANGINEAGQIVCTGTNAAFNQHAFLLTPVRSQSSRSR